MILAQMVHKSGNVTPTNKDKNVRINNWQAHVGTKSMSIVVNGIGGDDARTPGPILCSIFFFLLGKLTSIDPLSSPLTVNTHPIYPS